MYNNLKVLLNLLGSLKIFWCCYGWALVACQVLVALDLVASNQILSLCCCFFCCRAGCTSWPTESPSPASSPVECGESRPRSSRRWQRSLTLSGFRGPAPYGSQRGWNCETWLRPRPSESQESRAGSIPCGSWCCCRNWRNRRNCNCNSGLTVSRPLQFRLQQADFWATLIGLNLSGRSGKWGIGGAGWSARLLHVRVISATLLQPVGHAANVLAIRRPPKWPADRMGKGVFELLTQAVIPRGTNVF